MAKMTPEDFTSIEHDYVIIGGGAAGLALAARLTEDANLTVGVLEAGTDHSEDPTFSIPGLAMQSIAHPEGDWGFRTIPQKGTHDRVHHWPRGKGLGGSAMVNTMMYSMASKLDLDSWEELGNKGWNWETMLPYYRKQETFHPAADHIAKDLKTDHFDASLRGTDGPIQTTFVESMTGWVENAFQEAAKKIGYPEPKDPRLGTSLGAFNQLMCITPDTKMRSYSWSAYLQPHMSRSNVKVLTGAQAGKILLQKDGSGDAVATGVQFFVGGKEYTAKAKKEVICCAGTIQTPQILELSGIGDPAILSKFGIDTVVENPHVGTNLQDHPLCPLTYKVKDSAMTMETMRTPEFGQKAFQQYVSSQSGPLTSGLTGIGFSSLAMVSPELSSAELDDLVHKAREFQSTATKKQLLIQENQLRDPSEAIVQWIPIAGGLDMAKAENINEIFGHSFEGNWITLGAVSTHMFSRGTVHIASADPLAHPEVDPNYFSHPLDTEILGRVMLHARQLASTEPLNSYFLKDSKGGFIPNPSTLGPSADPQTLDEAREYVRWNSVTCYHPIGTASMLPKEEGGVVDTRLKVYGTKNVRVVDASVFPLHVQGNIMSLVYAIAERAADFIKKGE